MRDDQRRQHDRVEPEPVVYSVVLAVLGALSDLVVVVHAIRITLEEDDGEEEEEEDWR